MVIFYHDRYPFSLLSRITVRTAVFLAGAALMALEVAAFRIVGRSFGTALRETTTVIAVFMTSMSIGYWSGGRLGDRWPSRRTLAALLLSAAAMMVAVPWLDHIVSPRIAESAASASLHALIATASLFFIPTLFLSAVTPVAVRLFASETAHSGSTAGSISALSTIGSIAGTIASAFVLLDWLKSIDRTVLVLAVTMFLAALFVLIGELPRRLAVMVGGAAAAAAIVYAASAAAGRLVPAGAGGLLFVRDSPYHHVMVREHAGGTIRVLQFDRTATQTSMSMRDPNGAGLDYANYLHIAKLIHPAARSMLMIGLGGGTAVKQFARLYPDMALEAVELDPVVVDVAARFFFVAPSDRLRIHVSDGRVFLRTAPAAWDLIFIDSYTTNRYGSTIPPHLVTREFFEIAKRRLNRGGVLHFHLYAKSDAPISRAIHRTLAEVFPTVLVFAGPSFTEFFAMNTVNPVSKEELMARATPLPWADLRAAASTMLARPPSSGADPVLTDDYAPVDTLLRR
ncbi:MAG: fused MFS/spermidine synthase [Acidobacteriota bacterium]